MIKLINAYTGTEMFVSDERKEEYLAAGHKLAAEALPKVETTKVPTKKKATAKK